MEDGGRRKSSRRKRAVVRYSDEKIDVSFLKKRIRLEEQTRKRRLKKKLKQRKEKMREFHRKDSEKFICRTPCNSSRRRLAFFSPGPLSDDNKENFALSRQTSSDFIKRRLR